VKQQGRSRKLGVVERLCDTARNGIALLNAVRAQLENAEHQAGDDCDNADDLGNSGD
jgi:hypothetical protein